MTDLTARLLAEIERREGNWRDELEGGYQRSTMAAYLAALRKIVGLHRRDGMYCDVCSEVDLAELIGAFWPCPTIAAVAEALGIPTDDMEAA